MADLSEKPCKCGDMAKEVIYCQGRTRRGWLCKCGEFIPAIGREHFVGQFTDINKAKWRKNNGN